MAKATQTKLTAQLGDYLVGMFLVPWVWVWGFFIVFLITYLLGLNRGILTGFESFRFSSDFVNLVTIWITTFVFLIANYSIYHFTKYYYPRLKPLLFITSLFCFSVFVVIYFPFLIEVIRLE